MIVYKATNIINNKVYIGQTIKTLEQRRKTHESSPDYNSAYFQRAIKKYGKINFKWEVLEVCQTRVQLNTQEKFWIAFYCSNKVSSGYNLTDGGDSFEFNEEIKKKISQSITGEKNGFFGKKHSASTKQKVSQANKGKKRSQKYKDFLKNKVKGEDNPFFGKKHTEETKRKISIKRSGVSWGNHSDLSKKKISDSRKSNPNIRGKHLSESCKAKMSLKLTGQKKSDSTKNKMSIARKKYWENKRKLI
jgi:group I intron endonuclease